MKTTTQPIIDYSSCLFPVMSNKKRKNNYFETFFNHENGINPHMTKQLVAPPAHVWDRIEMILNNQSKTRINNTLIERNKDLLSPRKK